MKSLLFVLLALATMIAGCSSAPAPQSTAKPESVVETFLQALSRGDVNTCLSLLADDMVFQEPSIAAGTKLQFETNMRQSLPWHRNYSVIGPIKTDDDRVMLTIKETGDDLRILGLEYASANLEITVIDGKIKSWIATVNQEDLKKIAELTAGRIGIKFELVEQGMKVNEIASNSPAYEAGIRPGDIIIAVNDIPYSQMRERAGEMQLRIQGPVGTKVKMTVTHEGSPASVDIEVTRVSPEELRW